MKNNKTTKKKTNIKAIDFFCGAGGMTYGMRTAGVDVIAGIDIDGACKETYEYNNPGSKFIQEDIKQLSFEKLAEEAGIEQNDNDLIFIGCSPCQYWSAIRTIRDKSKKTRNLLKDFKKFVEYFLPGYIVIENVPGIYSKKKESGLENFLIFLEKKNYNFASNIINVNDYGIPQTRKRFLLIASRIKKVSLLKKKRGRKAIVRQFIGEQNGFEKVDAGHMDETDFIHTVAGLEEVNIKRLKKTNKNGGLRDGWKDDPELQIPAYMGKDDIFHDVYGRMSWDTPGPTITTKFFSLSNGRFGHPDELRAISLREGATLQTFPVNYIFKQKSIASIARLIGNAVPPQLSNKIAEAIIK